MATRRLLRGLTRHADSPRLLLSPTSQIPQHRATSTQASTIVTQFRRRLHTQTSSEKSLDTTPPPAPSPQALRPISHAFDPANSKPPAPPSPSTSFSIIRPEIFARAQEDHHATPIHPSSHRVPWPTSLPIALQSKHWRQAEAAATAYLQTISTSHSTPLTLETARTRTLIDTAVSYTVNLVPLSNTTRIQLLAKTYVLLFLHDDAVDTQTPSQGIPPRSAVSHNQQGSTADYLAYDILAKEVLTEDPHEGARLLDEIISWGSATQRERPKTFGSLAEYLSHGLEDFGADLILQTVRFACGTAIEDVRALERLKALCARHLLLTNDLYSYAKEVRAEAETGEVVLNAVRVVRGLMGGDEFDDALAARVLRVMIRDVEDRMSAECLRLEQSGVLSAAQLVYARAMVAAVAGNMFFSATSPRYAGAVAGTKLA
ncbi:terpenoid synthase [Aspergillus violaceofuscus CBS 115571]|uniref:Terpenoid synthase n=1 Tax=Aspergillus violaceofuscus (strain CBS 115571) TaxID=1450538 RepID=A0A2V5H889_ASPV1|nr:terpenoid synthase [Aspergillus violaceofuscus CBS 115571]